MNRSLKYIIVLLAAAIAVLLVAIFAREKTVSEEQGASSRPEESTEDASLYGSGDDGSGSETEPGSESGEPDSEKTDPETGEEPTGKTDPESGSGHPGESGSSKEESRTDPSAEALTIDDVAFIGDSRTVFMGTSVIRGVQGSAIVPDSRIFATYGAQLVSAETFADARRAGEAHPKKAVFWYGVNDVQLNPQRDDAEGFLTNFRNVIALFREQEPNAEIYILSVVDTAKEEKDYYEGQSENIARYNAALERYAGEAGFRYVDVTGLAQSLGDDAVFLPDNIHFTDGFYAALKPVLRGALGIDF